MNDDDLDIPEGEYVQSTRVAVVQPEPGLHGWVPLGDYLAWPAFGSSDLKTFRDGPPAMVPWRRANREPHTDATRIGTAAHCLILEPDMFVERFAHKPKDLKFSTKEGKLWRAAVPDGTIILTDPEWMQVHAIRDAFRSRACCREALAEAISTEASVVWVDPVTGLACKARPDLYSKDAVTDLKITVTAEPRRASKSAWFAGWMHQVAYQRRGLNAVGVPVKRGRLILINPEPPQGIKVFTFQIKADALDACDLENEDVMRQMAACVDDNDWPATDDAWTFIDMPPEAVGADDSEAGPDPIFQIDGMDLTPLIEGR